MFNFPSNISIKVCSKNKIEASTPDGVVFRGSNLGLVLKEVTSHYANLDEVEFKRHQDGFTVGQKVTIHLQKGSKVIDASGCVEGFPSILNGKIGVIESFDIYTMSNLNVSVNIDGVLYRGSTQDIKAI